MEYLYKNKKEIKRKYQNRFTSIKYYEPIFNAEYDLNKWNKYYRNEIPEEIKFSEVAKEAIDKTLTGENTVYTSVDRASLDKDGIDTNKLQIDKWENAEVKDYFKYEDNHISKITEEEAKDLYDAGENVVISVEDNDIVIGYTNVRK